MALGDKLPVAMEREKAVPGGLATLGADGVLAESQRPNLWQIKGGTKSNLLDNWYFPDPINQDKAVEWSGDRKHTIDRWFCSNGANYNALIKYNANAGLSLTGAIESALYAVGQRFEGSRLIPGRVYTLSALAKCATNITLRVYDETKSAFYFNTITNSTGDYQVYSGTFICPDDIDDSVIRIMIGFYGSYTMDVIAAKLELGPVQTLAHKEGDTWVLNDPPPNYALELLKCQRYQFVPTAHATNYGIVGFGSSINGDLQINIPIPVSMRVKPTITMTGNWELRGDNKRINFSTEDITYTCSQISGCYVSLDIFGIPDLGTGRIYQLTKHNDASAKIILDANL